MIYIYAVLNEKNIVTNIVEWEEPSTQSNYILINSYDVTLIGKYYNAETQTFTDPPAYIVAEMSTDDICYKQQDVWLNDVLDGKAENNHTHSEYATTSAMDTALNGKSDTTHTHVEYAPASHTHSVYITDEDLQSALLGKEDCNHTHTEYA